MLKWTTAAAVFIFMNYYCYKKISPGIAINTNGNTYFKIFLVFAGTPYITSQLLHFVFSIHMHHIYIVYPLIYSGFLWISALPTLCALCFLETGLSRVFPTLKGGWLKAIAAVFALRIFFLIKKFPYGKEIPNYLEISGKAILFGIYLATSALLYKIITGTLNLPGKKRGGLIIIFSIGPILAFFGIEIAVISLIMGFYALIFARVSAGLELSIKSKRIMITLLGIGIIISLPQMFSWGNILGNIPLYYIGGAWYGIIIIASTLFLLESGVALVFPSHFRRRVLIVLALLTFVSIYGITNGLRAPIVKEVVIPIEKLPPNTPDFIIVQWSDVHLGNLVSPQWFRETTVKTNNLKPDLLVITGDIIDNGFQKENIEALKQIKTKYGILAVTGNHEYYFNKLNIFLKIARQVGIRVLRNELVTLPNGIQIAGINDPTAPDFGDMKPSVAGTIKNSHPNQPLILLSHRAKFFDEAVRHGVDLQLSGHNHLGQIPPLDLFIYLTIKYSYGLFREGNTYIYTTCGTGLCSIPMRILSHSEITKIILKKK